MPESRPERFPAKYLPRLRRSLSITFGPPLDDTSIREALTAARAAGEKAPTLDAPIRGTQVQFLRPPDSEDKCRVRETVTAILQSAVEQLGYETSGPLLGCSENAATGPRPFHPRP